MFGWRSVLRAFRVAPDDPLAAAHALLAEYVAAAVKDDHWYRLDPSSVDAGRRALAAPPAEQVRVVRAVLARLTAAEPDPRSAVVLKSLMSDLLRRDLPFTESDLEDALARSAVAVARRSLTPTAVVRLAERHVTR